MPGDPTEIASSLDYRLRLRFADGAPSCGAAGTLDITLADLHEPLQTVQGLDLLSPARVPIPREALWFD